MNSDSFTDQCFIYNMNSSSNTVAEMATSSGIFLYLKTIKSDAGFTYLLFIFILLRKHDLRSVL